MTYIVKSLRGIRGTPNDSEEYLTALRYDRYQTGDPNNTHMTTENIEEAFVFQTLAAAEMAAVFIGGEVEEL